MSNIKPKNFDPTKKIARTEFVGYPNLITSSDLNRQTEGLTWRANQIESIVGLETDFNVATMTFTAPTLKVKFSYTKLYCRGASFSPSVATEMSLSFNAAGAAYYIHLIASTKTATFTDNDMTISGAEFEDGTKLAAANQIVYYNEAITSSTVISGVANSIGILGKLVYDGTDVKFIPNNTNTSAGIVPALIQQNEFQTITTTNVTNTINERLQGVKIMGSFGNGNVFSTGLLGMWADFYQDIVYDSTGVYPSMENSRLVGSVPVVPCANYTKEIYSTALAFIDPSKDLFVAVGIINLQTMALPTSSQCTFSNAYFNIYGNTYAINTTNFKNVILTMPFTRVDATSYQGMAQFVVPANMLTPTRKYALSLIVEGVAKP